MAAPDLGGRGARHTLEEAEHTEDLLASDLSRSETRRRSNAHRTLKAVTSEEPIEDEGLVAEPRGTNPCG